jgi:DNA-binding HxlR family transcriptional regulator
MLPNVVSSCNQISIRMKKRFADQHCSIAQALEVLGDWWTLLVVREAFLGARRFSDFEARLEISKNILAQRLEHLVEHGVLEKIDAGVHGQRFEYALTPMGKDLATLLTALRQWGDRWIYGEGNEPLVLLDRRTGRPVPRLRITGEDGAPLAPKDMELHVPPKKRRDVVDSRRRRSSSR